MHSSRGTEPVATQHRLRVCDEAPDSDDAQALLAELSARLAAITGDSGQSSFSADDLHDARAAFVVARNAQGKALGCGALRPLGDAVAEVKRMFAREGHAGVGTAVLAQLEATAHRLGYRTLWLETRRVNVRAVDFYLARGYRERAPYGRYIGRPEAICFEKDLPP